MLFSTILAILPLALAAPTKPGYVNIPLVHPVSAKNGSDVSNEEFVARLGFDLDVKDVRKYSSELVAAGVVKNGTYALSLGNDSEITFGGVNTGRYDGELQKVLGVAGPEHFAFQAGGNVNGEPLANSSLWFVDAGKTLTYLNPATYKVVFDAILHNAGVRLSSQDNLATYPCAQGHQATFQFDTYFFPIKLTLADFGIPVDDVLHNGDKETCFVGIGTSAYNGLGDNNVLGANFLKNFYSVFDPKMITLYLGKPAQKEDHYQTEL
ncbi:Acid extracellular protease [Yarrowia sp. B02]|nr:Acid extracellular protease [Yarrowia sp. B02]